MAGLNPLKIALESTLIGLLAGCGKPTHHQQHSKGDEAAAESPSASSEHAAARSALSGYEKLRDLLARDTTDGLDGIVVELAKQAESAASSSSGSAKTALSGMASAANGLTGKKGDWDALRKQFGELSKHTVALLVAVPELREGRHVFECPMAQGYSKWVQTSEEMANPYMGQKMLKCGGKTDWTV
jgi:hypothetical protein